MKRQHSLRGVFNVKLDYMSSCICSEVRLPLDQNVFGEVIVVKSVGYCV